MHSHSFTHSFNPWRAPGYAPVVDACGQAGGKFKNQHIGGDSVFTDNKVWSKFSILLPDTLCYILVSRYVDLYMHV